MTPAVSLSIILLAASQSSRGMKSTSNGVCGKPYHFAEFQVTAPAAAVRPWKPCVIDRIFFRPVATSAIRSAFSLASAPELTKKARVRLPGAIDVRASAARARTSSATALL